MPAFDDDGLTGDLGFLLSRVSGAVVHATNASLAPLGLKVRQYSVLALAADSTGGIPQRDLSAVLALDPSQIVTLVDDLVTRGLVTRESVSLDRRARFVVATKRGHDVRRQAAALASAGQITQLGDLDVEEYETLRRLLRRTAATVLPDLASLAGSAADYGHRPQS